MKSLLAAFAVVAVVCSAMPTPASAKVRTCLGHHDDYRCYGTDDCKDQAKSCKDNGGSADDCRVTFCGSPDPAPLPRPGASGGSSGGAGNSGGSGGKGGSGPATGGRGPAAFL